MRVMWQHTNLPYTINILQQMALEVSVGSTSHLVRFLADNNGLCHTRRHAFCVVVFSSFRHFCPAQVARVQRPGHSRNDHLLPRKCCNQTDIPKQCFLRVNIGCVTSMSCLFHKIGVHVLLQPLCSELSTLIRDGQHIQLTLPTPLVLSIRQRMTQGSFSYL